MENAESGNMWKHVETRWMDGGLKKTCKDTWDGNYSYRSCFDYIRQGTDVERKHKKKRLAIGAA